MMVIHLYHPHSQHMGGHSSPHPRQHLLPLVLLVIAIFTSTTWGLLVFSICISLVVSEIEHLSWTYWSFVYSFFRNVCWSPLPISKLGNVFLLLCYI